MASGADVPLSAPSLLKLAACSLAKSYQEIDEFENVHLPLLASHAVLDESRIIWNKKFREEDRIHYHTVLAPWCDSSRFPLSNLDLTGAVVDDMMLARLLSAHEHITSLDLSDVKGVSELANATLEEYKVKLPRLTSLRMTSMELLSKPSPKRKNGVAGMDPRNIPVLSEEDLLTQGGNGRLDQMRDARGNMVQLGIAQLPNQSNYEMNFADGCSTMALSDEDIQRRWDEEQRQLAIDRESEPPLFTTRCPGVTTLALPHMRRIPDDEETSVNDLLGKILAPLKDLRILDLSHWTRVDDLRCLNPLNLTSLILYDVPDLYKAVDSIIHLTELRFLDLSQSIRETGIYPKPVTALHRLVTHLPLLEKLDISSTNLAAQPSVNDWPVKPEKIQKGTVHSDIVGLRFLANPLKYLGLFNCENASHFGEIPAEHVAGDANEDQVITALQMYKERAGLLQSVLNESYQLYRFGNSTPLVRHTEALHLVLGAMQRHLDDSTLQIAGSASLFYIIRKVAMNRDTKKQVVSALLCGMETHMGEQVMVRNCCLSLCQFEIPQEILFDYSRLATLLVKVLEKHNADNLTQRIVVFLLNSMACHVEGEQKVEVGSFGAIKMILKQIDRKLTASVCDDVMEVGWSFLWNITDETPVNCQLFLDADGLQLFQKCYNAFSTERELVRNMMGLIGNIAEVDEIRHQLMKDDYITIFVALLGQMDDSIEISYNSAGVLAHMVSEGEEAWNKLTVKRYEVMESIMNATEAWKLNTRRFINYRSFRPILRLLPLWDSYASQHWAVWALANLTTTDGPKYCSYVTEEGGLLLLIQLVNDERTKEATRELASIVLENIAKNQNGGDSGDEAMDTDESRSIAL